MEDKEENTNAELNLTSSTRRELLKKALSLSATMAIANTGVYMIGAAFKELDGSLVAGAKCYTPRPGGPGGPGCSGFRCSPPGWYCSNSYADPTPGVWEWDNGQCVPVLPCP